MKKWTKERHAKFAATMAAKRKEPLIKETLIEEMSNRQFVPSKAVIEDDMTWRNSQKYARPPHVSRKESRETEFFRFVRAMWAIYKGKR